MSIVSGSVTTGQVSEGSTLVDDGALVRTSSGEKIDYAKDERFRDVACSRFYDQKRKSKTRPTKKIPDSTCKGAMRKKNRASRCTLNRFLSTTLLNYRLETNCIKVAGIPALSVPCVRRVSVSCSSKTPRF